MGADRIITTNRSLVGGVSRIMNMINEDVQDHHQKVAYIAYRIAEQMELPEDKRMLALSGGLLHDIGSVMLRGTPDLCEIESQASHIALLGGGLLKHLPSSSPIADVVKNSQTPLGGLRSLVYAQLIGQIVHLSDAVSILFDGEETVLNQIESVRRQIEAAPAHHFHTKVREAFEALCLNESVWMDMMYDPDCFLRLIPENKYVTLGELRGLSGFLSIIIDFRSPFTAMHSAGVAASAAELAKLFGMSGDECIMMEIAGNLHDVGKLRIPNDILEKPGKLTDEEFNIIKEHAYYTYSILSGIEGLDQIAAWAGFHHEKLNGRGYPYHLADEDIPFGSRIMAVADVFSALTEDRPYRRGMTAEKVKSIMRENADRGDLSMIVVKMLLDNYEMIDSARNKASHIAGKRYYESMEKGLKTGEIR